MEEDEFLSNVDRMFDEVKTEFTSIIPLQPFNIMVGIRKHEIDVYKMLREEEEGEEEREEEEEEEKKEEEVKQINTVQTFKSNECVICLTNQPNVLFCNCGHVAICEECGKMKSLKTCPVCKTENTVK